VSIVDSERDLLGDRYELQERIASGGMGEVWRGRDVRLGRPVAIKLLRSEYADDPSFTARFRAEATHAAGLSHPNIAAVHDYGETVTRATGERVAYLVMELVDGEPLSDLFRQDGPMDTTTALVLLRQAAAALAEAHRAGVVHRDVKPANILVDRDGQVKLTDFGIAWSAASVPLTRTGQVIGTPQYMSPEQASGETPRPASDVYALGLIGYESLSGHAAFDGDNPVTIALKQVQQEPEPLPAAVPDEVRSLIDTALTKDPDDRYPDADAFLVAIDATLEDPTGEHPATRPVAVRTAATRALSGAAPRGRPGTGRWTRRRAMVLLAAVVALLLGAGVVGVARTMSGSGGGPADAAAAATPEPGAIVLTAADHVGRPADEVAEELTALGLAVDRRDRVTARYAPGTVAGLAPAGSALAPGDEVLLDVAVAPAAGPGTEGPGAGSDVPAAGTAARTEADGVPTDGSAGRGDARATNPAVPSPAGGLATEDPATGGSATGGSATGGSATGGSATGGSGTGGSGTGGSATGGSATGGSATGGSATGGSATQDPTTGDPATEDPATDSPAAEEPAGEAPGAEEPATTPSPTTPPPTTETTSPPAQGSGTASPSVSSSAAPSASSSPPTPAP